jgi:hypothetical protein
VVVTVTTLIAAPALVGATVNAISAHAAALHTDGLLMIVSADSALPASIGALARPQGSRGVR